MFVIDFQIKALVYLNCHVLGNNVEFMLFIGGMAGVVFFFLSKLPYIGLRAFPPSLPALNIAFYFDFFF